MVLTLILLAVDLLPLSALAQPSLPDPALPPGAINPAVTQANIQATICVRGWTRTVRPPEGFTYRLKRRQIRQYGYLDRRLGHYEGLNPLTGSPNAHAICDWSAPRFELTNCAAGTLSRCTEGPRPPQASDSQAGHSRRFPPASSLIVESN